MQRASRTSIKTPQLEALHSEGCGRTGSGEGCGATLASRPTAERSGLEEAVAAEEVCVSPLQ